MSRKSPAEQYIRDKVEQLSSVLGAPAPLTAPSNDATLLAHDPIGTVAELLREALAQLKQGNQRLTLVSQELRHIFDTLGAAVVVLDADQRIEDCNRLALDWLFDGAELDTLTGRLASECCDNAPRLLPIVSLGDRTVQTVHAFGRDLQVVATGVDDERGQRLKTVVLFSDITQQKQGERRLQLYGQVFSHVGEGILITDADNRIIEVNDAFERITGYSRDELIGQQPVMLQSGLHEPAFYEEMWQTLRATGQWKGEILDRTKDGNVIALLESISEIRDADGQLTHHLAVITDISSLKETQSRLDFLAHHDPLTKLPNRLLFNDRLQHAVDRAQREGHGVALLFIDLDRFKNVNDSLGHHVGDLLLIEAARRLSAMVRRSDTLARLGGDEFVVLMEAIETPSAVLLLAEKIVAAFRQPFMINNLQLHVGCSIGMAAYPDDGNDAATLLKNADAAMYRAKAAGRDRHARYSAELSEATRQKLAIDSALRAAVRDGAFELHYQPIIDTATERVVACEALVRWPNGPAMARGPDRFIPVAEESGLIVPLGDWILRTALRDLARWRAAGVAMDYVSVNISAVQLAEGDFAERVAACLDEAGLPGSALQIELTENVLMADMQRCALILRLLRERGLRVSIDDFGTGYSSLAYLKQLPINNLKIDRSFVRDLPTDPNDCAIASAIVGMARTLGIDVIAEGIERVEQQTYLSSINCTKVQGYLYARPMPADEFIAFLAGR